MGRRGVLLTGLVASLAVLAGPAPGEGQEAAESAAIRASAFVAGSLRERLDGLSVFDDVRSFSARLGLPRQGAPQPWVQVGGFTRPHLDCPAELECNTDGWTALVGVALPLSQDDTRAGVQPYLVGGIGAGFSTENTFVYLVGAGTALALTEWMAPSLEVRWERLPGIRNIVMASLGLRLDLF